MFWQESDGKDRAGLLRRGSARRTVTMDPAHTEPQAMLLWSSQLGNNDEQAHGAREEREIRGVALSTVFPRGGGG